MHPFPRFPRLRRALAALAYSWACSALTPVVRAATIQEGDVTAVLGPAFFVDDTSLGGSDTDIAHNATVSFTRRFSGQLAPNLGPTRVVLTGFGFATHTNATSNDATTITVSFTYLGADEAIGGGDDVILGSATGNFVFSGGKEYVFAFDAPLAADLNITGTRFRIQIQPFNANHTGFPDTALKLKSGTLASEPSISEAKLSVAGIAAPLIVPDRVNLAKFQPVTASTTSGQRLASYVTDGVTGNDNRWQSANSTWNNARIDFPFPVEVGSAQVFMGENDTQPVGTFNVQYLDGSTWVTIPGAAVTGNTQVELNLVFTNPVTASSFRLSGQDSPLRIRELALYPPNGPGGYPLGTDLTLNLAYQRPVVATSHTSGNFPLKVVDGRAHTASFWQTNAGGTNTLDIDLRVSTKIGSAHLYSGSPGVSPLENFSLKSWNGTSWQDIPGAAVTGNTTADLVLSFTPVTTSRVRLEFTNPGITSIRELQVFPANPGNTGYPPGTNLIQSGAIPDYDVYHDAFHQIRNPGSNRFIAMAEGGGPALDQAGLTAAQGQYQVLLNLSNGTYRLRNRATGNCLSGARLSKSPGLALTDEPYSALPHQDWILAPLGGGAFQFVNVWSGLAIDTQDGSTAPATPLVQNTATGSTTQRWQIVYSENYPKKGVGGTPFNGPTRARWTYNWGRTLSTTIPADSIFLPMQWGNYNWDIGTNQGPIWQEYPRWRNRSDGVHLLGFNEPDVSSQANIPVNTAVSLWPRLQEMDLPLVSPAPASLSNGWLGTFYSEADTLGYRVNYTAVHTYPGPGGGSSQSIINTIQTAYNNWNRPVWLTEFSFVDWGKNQSWSEEDTYQALAEFLWRAESLPWLRKYALFVFTANDEWPQPANAWTSVTPGPRSNTYDANGNLTAFGKLYAAWDNDTTVRTDKPYYIHHRESRKRIANLTTQSNPGGRNIRIDGPLVRWSLVATGPANRYHIVSSLDGRRLSTDGTTVSLVESGTTGTAVEWSLTENAHGWFYIGHPASAKRLQLAYNNSTFVATYTMASNTSTGNAVQWRFIVPPPSPVWTGLDGNSWTNNRTWTPDMPAASGDTVTFNHQSVANLSTFLDQNFLIDGLVLRNPSGPVSIGGNQTLTVGAGGFDLSSASQDLTVTAPLVLGEAQNWSVGAGRVLNLNGGVSGAFFPATVTGEGTVALGGPVSPFVPLTITAGGTMRPLIYHVLANGAAAAPFTVDGTLDLNGTTQEVNAIGGSGVIDNTAPEPAQLVVGNHDVAVTLNTVLQDTGGDLRLIKTGSGNITLPTANAHAGGFTNNGSGNIVPQNANAFGAGPVVMNGSQIYPTAASYTFANALTLNGATLRIGGGNNRTITWTGPVTITGDSELRADGGTSGITLSGGVFIDGGTLASAPNNTTHTISAPITGTGTIMAASFANGTLNLNAANSFNGTYRSALGTLRIGNANALQDGTLDMNASDSGAVNLNNHNAVIGALTGSRNLGLGSGTVSIGNNHTDTIYAGILSGTGSMIKIGNGRLTLSGANSYGGTTSVNAGTLAMGANDVLPDIALSIADATFDAATFHDTIGALAIAGNATINLGTGATLAFAASNAIPWTGTLNITGAFVAGSSIRFGNNNGGLTPDQLGLITVNGGGSFALDSAGYLVPASPYEIWKSQITNGLDARGQDADGDGFSNLQEFLFGTPPMAGNGSLVASSLGAGGLTLRWLQRENEAGYHLKQSPSLAAGSWTPLGSPLPALDPDQSAVPPGYDRFLITIPVAGPTLFLRIEAWEN